MHTYNPSWEGDGGRRITVVCWFPSSLGKSKPRVQGENPQKNGQRVIRKGAQCSHLDHVCTQLFTPSHGYIHSCNAQINKSSKSERHRVGSMVGSFPLLHRHPRSCKDRRTMPWIKLVSEPRVPLRTNASCSVHIHYISTNKEIPFVFSLVEKAVP